MGVFRLSQRTLAPKSEVKRCSVLLVVRKFLTTPASAFSVAKARLRSSAPRDRPSAKIQNANRAREEISHRVRRLTCALFWCDVCFKRRSLVRRNRTARNSDLRRGGRQGRHDLLH